MKGRTYLISVLVMSLSITFFNNYQDRKHYIDRNIMNLVTATSLNINHSVYRISETLAYIENTDQSEIDIETLVTKLRREANDISDSHYGIIEVRGMNRNAKIHYGNFPRGVTRLVEKIEKSGELTESDIEDLKLISQVNMNTKTSNFYKSQFILTDSKLQEWVITQYDALDEIGKEIGYE